MEDKKELLKALALFRNKQSAVKKAKQAYKRKYPDYLEIRETVDILMIECGLGLYHQPFIQNEEQYVRTSVYHIETGQELFGEFKMVIDRDEKKQMSEEQRVGAANTYFNRYALNSLLGLKFAEDNDCISSAEDKILNAAAEQQQTKEALWRKRLKSAEILVSKLADGDNIPDKHIAGVKRLHAEMSDNYKQELALIVKSRGVNLDD